jgi:hypothetical protein
LENNMGLEYLGVCDVINGDADSYVIVSKSLYSTLSMELEPNIPYRRYLFENAGLLFHTVAYSRHEVFSNIFSQIFPRGTSHRHTPSPLVKFSRHSKEHRPIYVHFLKELFKGSFVSSSRS